MSLNVLTDRRRQRMYIFATRCYASAAYAVVRCLSVRMSVCPSVTFVDSVETNKYIFKTFSSSYRTSWQYSDGDPITGASHAGGVGTNRDSGRIAGYRSMTAAVRDQQVTVFRAVVYNSYGARCTSVYGTDRHASANTLKRRNRT